MDGSQPSRRAVTLEEALSIAIECQRNWQLEDAEKVYQRLTEAAPDHPGVLHFAGLLAHQMGQGEKALSMIERSLAIEPNRADWHSNLGIVLKARGKLDEAIEAYRRALELDPSHANAHCNLGVLLRARGKPAEAEESYRTAIRLDPEHVEAHHNLGVLLTATGRAQEAVVCFCKVLTLIPEQPGARTHLATAYCILGQRDKAVALFEQWLRECPGDPVAQHMLAACSGKDVPPRASDAYIERTFDDFAASFDSKLAELGYRAPQLVASALAEAGLEPDRSRVILDAGCGTGLCGPLLAPYAARLVGVDLSGGMLAQARARGLYDELVKQELTAYLEAHPAAYDVVVSADTLVYFGALEAVVGAAARALRAGGLLVFTVEELRDGGLDGDYRIDTHGRYSHRREYVETVLRSAGLHPLIVPAELRMERAAPVRGLVLRAHK